MQRQRRPRKIEDTYSLTALPHECAAIDSHQSYRVFVKVLFELICKSRSTFAFKRVKNFTPIHQAHVKRNFTVLRGYVSRRDAFVSLFLVYECDDGVRVYYEFRFLPARSLRAALRGGIG